MNGAVSRLDAGVPDGLARLVIESAADYAVLTTDPSGTITSWSPGAQHVLGWSAAEAVGQPVAMIFTPEDRVEDVPAHELRCACEEGQATDERWHLKRDGTTFWAMGQMLSLREGGALVGYAKILRDRTRERLVEERLRAAEAEAQRASARVAAEGSRLRQLFHQAPGFMCVLRGPEHVFEFTNAAYQQLVGHRDVVGKPLVEALPEVVGQGFLELLDRVYLTGTAFTGRQMRFNVQRSPGAALETCFVDLVFQPIIDEAGQVSGIFAEGSDVTEAYRAQEALQASEEFSRSVLASSSDCIKVLDLDGNLQFMSDGGQQVMEIDDFAAVAGCPWPGFWDGADSAWAAVKSAKAGGTGRFQGPAPTAKGTPRWWDVVVTPILGPDGMPDRLLSTSRDITALHEAQQAVAQSEAQLRRLNATLEEQVEERTRELVHSEARFQAYFEASPEYLFLVRVMPDDRLVFEDLNPAAQALYGLPRARFIGQTLAEVVGPSRAAAVEHHARECLRLGRPVRYEAESPVQPGRTVVLNVVVSPLETTDGNGGLVLFCGRDLTDQRRTEEQLRQAQKMEAVGQLTGGIAHDFNNLLAGISGSLELLQTRVAQGRIGDLERYLGAAQGAAKRAAALTHRLLAFSRRQTLDPKPTDVNRLVAGMEELVRRTVGPEVAVEVVAAGGLWATLVDPNQLENALLNLCINARDAMPGGGQLTIETGNKWLDERGARERDLTPGQYVSLCVSDNGAGMAPEVIARAFDPFFTTKPIGMGTGLGLSMVYGFTRQSGGQARIYSEPGQGTMVCLYLPRHHGEADMAEGSGERAEAPRAEQGETVLVVDDEPTVRMLVTEVLGDLGYIAVEAADGLAGLKVLQSNARIDLLVTDVGLPGMNGRQLADAARERRPGLKVLFITGYAENAVLSHGHLDPGMHVLTKPFAMDALAGRIKELIAGA